MKYVAELSKQDMMYFGILDFSQNNKKNTLQEALGKNDYDRFKTEFTTRAETRASAGNTCKRILIRMEEAVNKKQALKDEKERVLTWNDGTSKQTTLWILKTVKLFYFNIKPVDYANEDSYLYFVLSPIFKNILCNHPFVSLLFGEVNLKAKAIEVNRYLYEDQRRLAGPKIDIIVKDTKYNMEIMIIEVSGPPNKISQTHFLEDRNKICKNLKAMFKHIVSQMEVPSVTLIKKLRLFGLQFYNDQVYVYSLCKPCKHSYVFVQDFKFSCLGQSTVLAQLMPSFFKNFYAISRFIENTHDILDELLGTIDKSQDILEESSEEQSPHASPQRKQKKTKT